MGANCCSSHPKFLEDSEQADEQEPGQIVHWTSKAVLASMNKT